MFWTFLKKNWLLIAIFIAIGILYAILKPTNEGFADVMEVCPVPKLSDYFDESGKLLPDGPKINDTKIMCNDKPCSCLKVAESSNKCEIKQVCMMKWWYCGNFIYNYNTLSDPKYKACMIEAKDEATSIQFAKDFVNFYDNLVKTSPNDPRVAEYKKQYDSIKSTQAFDGMKERTGESKYTKHYTLCKDNESGCTATTSTSTSTSTSTPTETTSVQKTDGRVPYMYPYILSTVQGDATKLTMTKGCPYDCDETC